MSTGLSRDSDKLGETASERWRQESAEKTLKSCKEETSRAEEQPLSRPDAQSDPIVNPQIGTVGDGFEKCFRFLSLLFNGEAVKLWESPLCTFGEPCEVKEFC